MGGIRPRPPGSPRVRYPGASPVRYPGASGVRYPGASPVQYPGASPVQYPGASPVRYPGASPVPSPGCSPVRYPGRTRGPALLSARDGTATQFRPTKLVAVPVRRPRIGSNAGTLRWLCRPAHAERAPAAASHRLQAPSSGHSELDNRRSPLVTRQFRTCSTPFGIRGFVILEHLARDALPPVVLNAFRHQRVRHDWIRLTP